MTHWSTDISTAPRGKTVTVTRTIKGEQREIEEQRREYILAVQSDNTVVMTCWIPPRYTQSGKLLEGNRWSGFNLGSEPIAWAPWPTYESVAKASCEQTEGTTGHTGAGSRREMRVGEAPARVPATSDDGRDSVERHAPNSPEMANETMGGLPVAAASGTAEETGRTDAYTRTGLHGTPHVSGVTGGESAAPLIVHRHIFLDDAGSGV